MNRRHFLKNSFSFSLATLLGQQVYAGMNLNVFDGRNKSRLYQDAEIYQTGKDSEATWLYLGFLPRMQDPKRIKIIASYEGLSVRVSMWMTQLEVSKYADYIYQRALHIAAIRRGQNIQWSDGIYATPFEVISNPNDPRQTIDEQLYADFMKKVREEFEPVRFLGYQANLDLLKREFPMSVFERNEMVEFHIVFPATPPARVIHEESEGGDGQKLVTPIVTVVPAVSNYTISGFEERRTRYSKSKNKARTGYIFGGFPAFWFNGQVGFHGPIRWVDPGEVKGLLEGSLSDTGIGPGDKIVSKRWQLHRVHESHGCYRMEHILAMRAMMPADMTDEMGRQPNASQVKITVIRDIDRFDINGDGILEIMGVNYYWLNHRAPNKKQWLQTYYKNENLNQLYEFPYTNPGVVQIQPLNGNPYTLMSRLNRAPFGEKIY